MSIYQKCPVCDGTGLVSRPPNVAGDVLVWTDNKTGPYPCKTCLGTGIIKAPEEVPRESSAILTDIMEQSSTGGRQCSV